MKPHLYFIAIVPPADIADEIVSVKNEMAEKYNSRHALKSPAHITLQMPFKRNETIEEPLKHFLKAFSGKNHPFEIELNGFGHFDDRVIYINVTENQNLQELFSKLNNALREQLHFPEKETPHRFHPHVTVAHRDLTPEQFKIAWEQFRHRNISKKFSATKISLLKHNFKFWEIISEFEFKE